LLDKKKQLETQQTNIGGKNGEPQGSVHAQKVLELGDGSGTGEKSKQVGWKRA